MTRAALLGLSSCQALAIPSADAPLPNVVIVLIDDVGRGMVGALAQHDSAPSTPNLDALAQQGVLFTQAYANPSCSPTRAALMTGLHGFHNGVGNVNPYGEDGNPTPSLSTEGPTLPKLLAPTHHNVVIGKWHLAQENDLPDHPFELGFERFRGTKGNTRSHYTWPEYDDFWPVRTRVGYAPTTLVDDAIEEILQASEPLFLYVPLLSVHVPYQLPPPHLIAGDLPTPGDDAVDARLIMESVDTEVGRLLDILPEDTWVFVLSDNGSPGRITRPPFANGRGKGSVTRAGVNVPMIVAGPGVVPGESSALVHVVDFMATIGELLGLEVEGAEDSVSFAPTLFGGEGARGEVYAERFLPAGNAPAEAWNRSIRSHSHSLVHNNSRLNFHDLRADPREEHNLLKRGGNLSDEAARELQRLARALDEHRGDRYPSVVSMLR